LKYQRSARSRGIAVREVLRRLIREWIGNSAVIASKHYLTVL
jgi:hypothetical protein